MPPTFLGPPVKVGYGACVAVCDRTTGILTDLTDVVTPETLKIDWTLNGRSMCSFGVQDVTLPYLGIVYIHGDYDNGKGINPLWFAGIVLPDGQEDNYAYPDQGTRHGETAVRCGDFSMYGDWCHTNATCGYAPPDQVRPGTSLKWATAPSLEAVVEELVTAYLEPLYGVALGSTGVSGITLAPFLWDTSRLSDCFRELIDRTGWILQTALPTIGYPQGYVYMTGPASLPAAPFALTPDNCLTIDRVSAPTQVVPANWVTLKYGPEHASRKIVWTTKAAGIAGGADGWTLSDPGLVPVCVAYDGATDPQDRDWSISTAPDVSGDFLWTPGATHGHLTENRVGYADLPAGDIQIIYDMPYPMTYIYNWGGDPTIQEIVRREDILTEAAAIEFCAARIQRTVTPAYEYRLTTLTGGLRAGQWLTISPDARWDFDETILLTSVSASYANRRWEYDAKGTSGSVYLGARLDAWRDLLGSRKTRVPYAITTSRTSGSRTKVGPQVALGLSPFPLGGSRERSVPCGTTASPVIDHQTYGATASFSAVVRVECRARLAGHGVTPSLWDVTSSSSQAGAKITGTDFVSQDFAVSIVSGHSYYLRAVTDDAAGSAYAIGELVGG